MPSPRKAGSSRELAPALTMTGASWLLAILVVGVLQLASPSEWKSTAAPDYGPSVESLLEGRPFLDEHGSALVRFPPLFPILVAAEFRLAKALGWPRIIVTQAAGALMVATSAALVFFMVSWFVPSKFAFAASLAVAALPHLVYATLLNLSVVPFLVCFLAALLCLMEQIRKRRSTLLASGLCGLFLALAMLLRPIALYLPVLFVPVLILCSRSKTRPAHSLVAAPALLLAVLVVVLVPWETWAHHKTGRWIPLSTAGAATLRDGVSFNHKGWREPLPFGPRLAALQEHISESYPDLETGGDLVALIAREFKRDPLAVAQLYTLKAARSWYGTDAQNRRTEFHLRWIALAYLLPTILAGWVCARTVQLRNTLSPRQQFALHTALLVLLILGYFWAITALVATLVRYMVPVFATLPLLWCCALYLKPITHKEIGLDTAQSHSELNKSELNKGAAH